MPPLPMTKRSEDPHGLVPDQAETVLVILDLISDFDFADGEKIARAALPVAKRIARLKSSAAKVGIPVIYVNDAVGRWRSDFRGMVRHCQRENARGRRVVDVIAPGADDYCILKPKHSGFFATPLDTVLKLLGAKRLILTGVSSNQCVLFTANDAYVRDLELLIPSDCISARTRKDTALAVQYFKSVLGADLTPSTRLRLSTKRSKRAR
jgi:nicotinamidase-related amidase